MDAGLCHGAAGLGHLYNRLYQATGEVAFARASHAWLKRTIAMRRPGLGIAGYVHWHPGSGRWRNDPGLLTGAAGVGLALGGDIVRRAEVGPPAVARATATP